MDEALANPELILDSSVPSEPEGEDYANVLPGLELNHQQQDALALMEAFVASEERLFLLTGYAGTGKTTLLQALLTRLRDSGDRRKVAFTALSNKATKVLAEMAFHWSLNVDCMTLSLIHIPSPRDLSTSRMPSSA